MSSFEYFLYLINHIIDVIKIELTTENLFDIFFIGIIEFTVFYYFSKFAKNIVLKTFLFSFAVYTLWESVQDDTILTEPLIFATFGLMAPHFDIFSLWIRYIRKLFLALKTMIMSFLEYIFTPFKWIIHISQNIAIFFRKKENKNQEGYKEEKTYKDYFNENKDENYEKQKSDYFKNRQNKYSSHNKNHKEQNNNYRNSNQEKNKSEKKEQKSYSRWDSSNPYEVLGVPENATKKEIKKAFRDLAKKYHPDFTQEKKEEHKIIFQKINNAYKLLITK